MNSNQKKILNYSYDLLARRRYSIREMVKKLEAHNHKLADLCNDQELEEILKALVKANLLNDNDFAFFYLDSQMRRKPVGKLKIRQQLRQKGIDEKIIAQALNKAELDEVSLARQLLAKKAKSYTVLELKDIKTQAKLLRYLASNGFTSSISYRALKDLCQSHLSDQLTF